MANKQQLISLIKSAGKKLEESKKTKKGLEEQLDEKLGSDDKLNEINERSAKVSKEKRYRKLEVIQEKHLESLVEKIKESKDQIKDLKMALNDYLMSYVALTGNNEIELNGESQKIIMKCSVQQMRLF